VPKNERIREPLSGLPTLDHLVARTAAGWKLIALEWERPAAAAPAEPPLQVIEEIPYGLKVADDCTGLVESPSERQIILIALDMIVEDRPLSHVADELNRRGFRTREGKSWTPAVLFALLPRMIQVGPKVFASEEWNTRKQRLPRVV
jgi:hypothetical protein